MRKIWSDGWALAPAGPYLATPEQPSTKIEVSSLSRNMVPLELGASTLGVALVRPRTLVFEFSAERGCVKDQARRRACARCASLRRVQNLECRLGHMEKKLSGGYCFQNSRCLWNTVISRYWKQAMGKWKQGVLVRIATAMRRWAVQQRLVNCSATLEGMSNGVRREHIISYKRYLI